MGKRTWALRTLAEASHFLLSCRMAPCSRVDEARAALTDAVVSGCQDDIQKATKAVEVCVECCHR